MVNSIGSGGVSSYTMQSVQGMQRHGPQDLFKKVDSDASGGVSQAELKTLVEDISSRTGNSIKVDDSSFPGYDTDGSGSLSEEELMTFMNSNGFGPPQGIEGGAPGTSTSKDRAAAAYAANSGGEALSSLIAGLQNLLEQLQSGSENQEASRDRAPVDSGGGHHGPQEFFAKVDSDGSGGASQEELKIMADNMQEMTGQSLTVDDDTFSAADSDSDGSLNADELKSFMDKSGIARPAPPPPPSGGMAMAMPDDDSTASSSSSSSENTEKTTQEHIDLLKYLLERLSSVAGRTGTDSSASVLNIIA